MSWLIDVAFLCLLSWCLWIDLRRARSAEAANRQLRDLVMCLRCQLAECRPMQSGVSWTDLMDREQEEGG